MMIEKVLEAYEAKISEEMGFWKRVKNMSRTMKIIFWGIIFMTIVAYSLFFIFYSITPIAAIIVMLVYVPVTYILTNVFERIQHKRWETNLQKYNQDIDIIVDILKEEEFGLYEKNKIKQLIRKYHLSIEQLDKQNEKKSSGLKEFVCTYIIPLITFLMGRINTSDSTNAELVVTVIFILIVILSGKYICSCIKEIIEMISWNQLEKERHFVLKLQDLLDRDFVIEINDLLPSK